MADTPLRNDADPEWRAIHQAAEQDRAELTRALEVLFAGLAARTVLLRLRSALQAGQLEQAMQAVPVADLLTLRPVVEEILRRVAMQGARIEREATMVVRLGSTAGLPVEAIAFWARQHSAALVTAVTEQTRQAIRDVIVDAIRRGLSPAKAAPLIEAIVGLNRVQAGAVLARAAELLAQGKTAAQIERAVERYARKLLKQRARVIARHELLQAANEGRRQQWERNVRDGLIAPDRWEREWVAIVPSDGRTCAICIGLDGARAPLGGVYPDGSSGPPAHVLCRCTEVLRRKV